VKYNIPDAGCTANRHLFVPCDISHTEFVTTRPDSRGIALETTAMPDQRWARLREDVDCGLRRGAWYKTVVRGWTKAQLEVYGMQRTIPLRYLEIVDARPDWWTVVAHAKNASVIPDRWAKGYAVCPRCGFRQLPVGRPATLRCDDCLGVFQVAWSRPYLGARSEGN